MPADPYAIFLDTQVFEAASFNFKMTALVSLEEQVKRTPSGSSSPTSPSGR